MREHVPTLPISPVSPLSPPSTKAVMIKTQNELLAE